MSKESQLADSSVQGSLMALDKAEADRMVFLADGAMWSDEVYRLRSLTPSDCVRFLKATQPQGVKK